MHLLRKIQNILGIDGAISYTLLGKGIAIFTTVFTVFFLARYLSAEEQGYYYTFASILSIQIFFELGLNNIITQFVAHEYSYLKVDDTYHLQGADVHKSRLSSLLRFCTKWYSIFAAILLLALLIAGVFFFQKYSNSSASVTWKIPWILLAVSSVLNFLTSPINAYMQGLGKVKEIARIRFVQQIFLPIIVWGGLMVGAKLFVSGLNTLGIVLINIYMFKKSSFDKILVNIWNDLSTEAVAYMKEIFPYQWRIALSWISGYFTFQLFNPVIFAIEGPVSAGKMGMTISAANAIQAVLMSWINTKVPLFSGLIEQKRYQELDSVFYANFKRIIMLGFVLCIVFISLVYTLQHGVFGDAAIIFGERFEPILPLSLMTFAIFIQVPVAAWATYLRCHLQEPFLVNSVVLGAFSLLSTFILGKAYGTIGLSIGYLAIQCISVAWGYIIYTNKRKEWHK